MRRVTAAVALLLAASALAEAQSQRASTLQRRRAEQEITSINADWARAARAADTRALGRILADDFTLTTADGEVLDKRQYLAEFASGDRRVSSLATEGHQARVHGDAAVLSHGGELTGTYKGRDAAGRYRWTHFYVRRGRRWLCVATQVTRIREPNQPRRP